MRRWIAAIMLTAFCGSHVLAADLQTAIAQAVSQTTPAPNASTNARNPYLLAGFGIMAAGAALLIYGTTRETERFCTGVPPPLSSQLNQPPVSCVDNTHGKPALMVSGMAVAAAGAIVLAMGEKKRSSVSITRDAVMVQHRILF